MICGLRVSAGRPVATSFAPARLDPCSLDIAAPEGGCYWCGGKVPHV